MRPKKLPTLMSHHKQHQVKTIDSEPLSAKMFVLKMCQCLTPRMAVIHAISCRHVEQPKLLTFAPTDGPYVMRAG